MNTPALTLLAGLLVTVIPLMAYADATALSMQGKLSPTACHISVDDRHHNIRVDPADLDQDKETVVAKELRIVLVDCARMTRVALSGIDTGSQAPSTPGQDRLGLGGTGSPNSMGWWQMEFFSLAENMLTRDNDTAPWQTVTQTMLPIGSSNTRRITFDDGSGQPPWRQSFTFWMKAHVVMAPAKDLDLTNDVSFEGSASIVLHYL